MKKIVKITALVDRPTLNLKQGMSLEMELEGDALIALHNEEIKGLIKIDMEKDLD